MVKKSMQEEYPSVELSLAPPLHPWPQIAAEIGNLEHSRENTEHENMDQLQREFNKAAVEARHRIGDVIGRLMHGFDDPKLEHILSPNGPAGASASLRQLPQETLGSSALAVKVNVLPATPPDPALRTNVENIEYYRAGQEKDMFKSALGDVKALTDFVLNELEVQVQERMSSIAGAVALARVPRDAQMLEGRLRSGQLPAQSNVRVAPNDVTYPTLVSMAQAMEARRDIAENLVRARILEKELDFLIMCNNAVEEGLRTAITRILAQYRTAAN